MLAAVANGTAPNAITSRRFHELAAAVYAGPGICSDSSEGAPGGD